jgi:hypothetical protein
MYGKKYLFVDRQTDKVPTETPRNFAASSAEINSVSIFFSRVEQLNSPRSIRRDYESEGFKSGDMDPLDVQGYVIDSRGLKD